MENFGNAMGYQFGPMVTRAQEYFLFDDVDVDSDYNYAEDMEGFETYQVELIRAKNKQHADFIKNGIRKRLANRKELENVSWYAPSQLLAGALDLGNLAFAFPVVGQLGLIPRAGMTIGQAAKASTKGGFVAGAISEAYRAPFDPVGTKEEVFANLLTTTAFGTILGTTPSVMRNSQPALKKTVNNIRDFHTDRGSFKDNMYEGTEIRSTEETLKTRSYDVPETSAEIVIQSRPDDQPAATYKGSEHTIYIDRDRILASFDDKPWTKPKVKGVKALDENEFIDAEEWYNFVLTHEVMHTLNRPKPMGFDVKTAKGRADYENAINDLALAEIRRQRPVELSRPVTFAAKDNVIHVNDEAIAELYEMGIWTVPEVEGATPLLDRDIISFREYKEFLIHKEKIKSTDKRKPGESDASYADRINEAALQRTREGYGLEKTAFNNSVFYRMITTPGKRILGNDNVPDIAKRYYNLLSGTGSMIVERTKFGTATQSIEARSERHQARAIAVLSKMRAMYDRDKGKKSKLGGATSPLYERLRNAETFDEWFEIAMTDHIARSREKFSTTKTDIEKEIDSLLEEYFSFYREFAEDTGTFKTAGDLENAIKNTKAQILAVESRIASIEKMGEAKGYTKKQLRLLELDNKRLARLKSELEMHNVAKENGMTSERYYFPLYYDKQRLKAEPELKARFIKVIEEHLEENPITHFWDEDANNGLGAYVERTSDPDPVKEAEDIVENMLTDSVADIDYNGPPSAKHIMRRKLNIPEWKVNDFIIKRPEVFMNYGRQMGNRLEYRNVFGKASIDDLLDDIDRAAVEEGKLDDKQIAKLKADFLADYERVMGIHLRNPDRMDAQVVRIIQDVASVAFLGKAGFASVTDAGTIIMQHGLQRSFDDGVMKITSTGRGMSLDQLEKYVVGLDLSLNSAQQRFMSDNTIRLEPNAVERVLNPITNAFYNIPLLGNNLGVVTRFGKRFDAPVRANKIIEYSRKYDSLTDDEIRELGIMGIDREMALRFAQMPYQETKDGFYVANLDEWDNKTALDRQVRATWETAMNIGVGNSVIMARVSERPLMMDGILYVEYKPWMKNLGFVIDERISSDTVKYTRFESKVMGMPFQFMSFTLGATQRITNSMLDPQTKYRLQSAMALIGLGYFSLQLKHEDWWFEQRSTTDILARSIDASGILGVYSELGYMMMHLLVGNGIYDDKDGIIQGKYRPTPFTSITEPLGAGPGLVADYVMGIKDLLDGGTTVEAERLKYLLPILPLFGLKEDIQDFIGDTIAGR